MYRALEAHTTIYLALYQLHLEKFLEVNPTIEKRGTIGSSKCHHQCTEVPKGGWSKGEWESQESHRNLDFELLHYLIPLYTYQFASEKLDVQIKDLSDDVRCQCQGCENNDQNDDLNDIVTGSEGKPKELNNEN